MAKQVTLGKRLRYRVDNFLARGSGALFLSLVVGFLGSLFVIAVFRGALNLVASDTENSFWFQLWIIFLELTDPGNMGQDNDTPEIFKVAAVIAGLTGVTIFSALIAFLTTALDQAIAHLKKGHSDVIEEGHTLILGWGPRVIEILRELSVANESEKDPVVVILAREEKETMDEYLRERLPSGGHQRVVTRNGRPASIEGLARVSAATAKSAIVLADCEPSDPMDDKLASDARVIKAVLALATHMEDAPNLSVVAEIYGTHNRSVLDEIAPGRVVVVDAEEILAKIMVQTSRTSGLSVVYQELLSFDGCELYFHNAAWGGLTFGELLFHFVDGVPIGVRTADGTLTIRPGADTVLSDDDEILIVANDDSTIAFRREAVIEPKALVLPERDVAQQQERKLILGWSPKARIIVREYADYVLEGSSIDVVLKDPPDDVRAEIAALSEALETVTVSLIQKDPLLTADLRELDPYSYNDVIILPQRPGGDSTPERVDSETIMVLLHLRRLLRERGEHVETKVITEVLDSSNHELISQAGVNDFIISNRMVSMIFAQLSEEPGMQLVYDNMFAEEGSEIYVKPISLYFDELPVTCRFGDLIGLAQKRDGEVCIGYKRAGFENRSAENYGITLIPPKDDVVSLSSGDALVVVAEDDR